MNNIVDIEIKRNIIWHRYRIYRNWHPCCWRFQQLCCLCMWCCSNRASNDLEGKKEKPENELKNVLKKHLEKTSLLDIETSKMQQKIHYWLIVNACVVQPKSDDRWPPPKVMKTNQTLSVCFGPVSRRQEFQKGDTGENSQLAVQPAAKISFTVSWKSEKKQFLSVNVDAHRDRRDSSVAGENGINWETV